jgi:hypothetical protein
MSDIPVCQNCGKKLYKQYGGRGLLATPSQRYSYKGFKTQEERDIFERDEMPKNAYNIDRNSWNENHFNISYHTPQQPRDGLFHSQYCFYEWHEKHRDEIERLIRDMGEWKNPN